MSSLRKPGLGPIVGDTTHKTCRIWIRAGDPGDTNASLDEDRRTVGVIGIVKGKKIDRAWYFRLQREFDRTGTFVVGKDVQLGFYDDDFIKQSKPVPKPDDLPLKAQAIKLEANTTYTVRVGTLTIDDPMPNDASLPDWQLFERLPDIDKIKGELLGPTFNAEECEATFRTFPAPDTIGDNLSFLLGSCRYPGLLWKIKEADRIFKPMADHLVDGPHGKAARFTVMCGDQIYADEFNRFIIGRADSFEEFQQRYVAAYSAPNLRQLLRMSPTYMILDDHEIEDNWTQDRIYDVGKHKLFNLAIGAYQSYQWSHSPRTFGRLLYYTFACAGYPAFVLDTRTQRSRDMLPGLEDNHMLGSPSLDIKNHPGQLEQLKRWLLDQHNSRGNAPKFIVSASVFAPNDMSERIEPTPDDTKRAVDAGTENIDDPFAKLWDTNVKRRNDSDSWPAYPQTRLSILKHIVDNKIQNVVFLSGDIHCSNVAEIEFDGAQGKGLKAFSVTSSAFYWPFPFADGDPNSYVHDSRDPDQADPFPIVGTDAVMNYRSFGYTQEDNFTRIDIDRANATMAVRVFNRDGDLVTVDDRDGNQTEQNVLKLAKW